MSSSNVMEVITVGRYEDEDLQSTTRSSTSHSTRTESQLSLEYLPPEAPHYSQAMQTAVGLHTDPGVVSSSEDSTQLERDDLIDRIKQLSDKVRCELGDLESTPPLHAAATHSPNMEGSIPNYELNTTGSEGSSSLDLEEENDCMELATSDSIHESLRNRLSVSSSAISDDVFPTGGDPKLRIAMDKMKKLDKKLADLTKKEREVKRQRQLLEQQMEGAECTDIIPRVEDIGDQFPTSPVFATQLDDNASSAGEHCPTKRVGRSKSGSHADSGTMDEEELESSASKSGRQNESKGETNFIRRNIQLASDAGALIAMTETEKKRLEELLDEDSPETEDPYAEPLSLPAPSGFTFNQQDTTRMRGIDSRLHALMPPEEWESVCSSSRNVTPALTATTLTPTLPDEDHSTTATELEAEVELPDMSGTGKHNIVGPGEVVLQQFQISREVSQRLRDIEDKLKSIQQDKELEQHFVPSLSESELEKLLEQGLKEQNLDYPNGSRSSSSEHELLEDVQASES